MAVDVPPSDALSDFARDLRASGAPLKVVASDRIHVTVKFLGDTEEGLVADIVEAIRAACRGTAPFSARIRGTGAFPGRTRMNVVWVGLEGADALRRIAADLDRSLVPLGFPSERRPWAPHVTIARAKGARNLERVRELLDARADADFGTFPVEAVQLKESVLSPEGPRYTTVASVPLLADVTSSPRRG